MTSNTKPPLILIHGIGNHQKGWSQPLRQWCPPDYPVLEFTYEEQLEASWSGLEYQGLKAAWGGLQKLPAWLQAKADAWLDIPAYFKQPAVAQASQAQLAAYLQAHPQAVVVAHSLGSVLAYETLAQRPDLAVQALVTLGSPLGRPWVQGWLQQRGALAPLALPWLNVYGAWDWVCGLPGFNALSLPQPTCNVRVWQGHDLAGYLKRLPWAWVKNLGARTKPSSGPVR